MRRATVIGGISLVLWVGVAPDAAACRCFGGPVCVAASRSDVAFIGRATSFTGGVRFEVERAFMGVGPGTIMLRNRPGDCGLSFTIGERYFVYAFRDRFTGGLTTNICTRTRPLSDPHTRADIAFFTRRRPGEAARPLLTGVVSDMTFDLAAPRPVGRPIANVRITATPLDGGRPRSATTRADGSYELTGVRNGRVSIAASLPAEFEPHQPQTVTIDGRRSCAEVDVEARIDGRISGQLLDERGQPLVRSWIHLADPAQARAAKSLLRTIDVLTDVEGRLLIPRVAIGLCLDDSRIYIIVPLRGHPPATPQALAWQASAGPFTEPRRTQRPPGR